MPIKAFDRLVLTGTALSVCLVAVIFLREYLAQQLFNLALGLLAIPFVLRTTPDFSKKWESYRFAALAILFAILSFYMPVYTWVYFSTISVALFIVELYWGRVNFLTILVILLSLPFTSYLVDVFSFPIRIWLTTTCGVIFQSACIPVEVAGNTFLYEGVDFTVDPACMGLNMLIASLLAGVLLLGFYQKKQNKRISYPLLTIYLIAIFVLNILFNFVRLMTMVIFRIYPETIGHELVGILCFLLQLIPTWGLCLFLIRFFPKTEKTGLFSGTKHRQPVRGQIILLIVCCGLLWSAALSINQHKKENKTNPPQYSIPGYTTESCPFGVTKLENNSSLIYLKPIRWFCDSEHNPMLCWGGSGYHLSQVEKKEWNSLPVYTAILQKENNILYTAWWYDNGKTATISQIDWRWDMLSGAPAYTLINVTVAQENLLEQEIFKIKRWWNGKS